jgi:hypothetical protein
VEAGTVWLEGAVYISLWESVEGQMEAQAGEHVISHFWLSLVLFRVSEAGCLEEMAVASDVMHLEIIYFQVKAISPFFGEWLCHLIRSTTPARP